jgi:alpha-galactosidase
MWRNTFDLNDSWNSVMNVIRFFIDNEDDMQSHAGPGHWNDPDTVINRN